MTLKNKITKFINAFVKPTTSRVQLISENTNGFYSWGGDIFKSDIVRSCIRPFANAVCKLEMKHIRGEGKDLKVNPEAYIRFFLEEPNPNMTAPVFLERLATQYKLNNNGFACIFRDEFGFVSEMYPIPALNVEAVYSESKELYLKFALMNGKIVAFKYADVIHVARDYNRNDVFGESSAEVLTPLMEIVNTTDQGIVKAIKNSGIIKWLMQIKTQMRDEDIDNYVSKFNKRFLDVETSTTLGGVAATDAKADLKQVEPKDYVPNASQMEKTTQRLYNYFGVNEKIIQSKWSEDEWNAFYENEIEPFAIKLASELTRKVFSRRERGCNNKIVLASAALQNASMSSKLNLMQMVDRGAMTANEWRKVLNLEPIEGGDVAVRRLEYGEVGSNGNNNDKGNNDDAKV